MTEEDDKAERIRRANIVFTGRPDTPPLEAPPMHRCPLCGHGHFVRKAGP